MPRRSLLSRLRGPRAVADRPAGAAECRYLAVIMDGNGRWAKRRRLPVAAGHKAGARALRRLIERALDHQLQEVTVYSFSSENWRRPPEEVAALMELFIEQIETQVPEVQQRGVRVRFVGRRTNVPADLLARIDAAEAANPVEPRMTMFIAFNYGGRDEILDAAAAYAAEPGHDELTEESFRRFLYAPDMHDPELMIRTSGEERISNFLLWELAYSELYFTPKLWPDFGPGDLDEALEAYAHRARRFGGR